MFFAFSIHTAEAGKRKLKSSCFMDMTFLYVTVMGTCGGWGRSSLTLERFLRLIGFGNIHVNKPTTMAATNTPIETTTANFPFSLNPELVLLPPLPPGLAVGEEELWGIKTVFAVATEGPRASDEVCVVVAAEEGFSELVYAVAIEADNVSEIADNTFFEKERVSVEISGDAVGEIRVLDLSDKIVVEKAWVFEIAEKVVVEMGLSWAIQ